MDTEVIVTLEAAKELISKGWCRAAFARNVEWEKVDVYSDKAVQFCAMGALNRATPWDVKFHDIYTKASGHLESAIMKLGGHGNIISFNDNVANVGEVIAAFDLAIELAKQEK